ncbi:MAG: choice-of-anchor tandem repeat GloVer-containing protein [Limisphaerales bacterium]
MGTAWASKLLPLLLVLMLPAVAQAQYSFTTVYDFSGGNDAGASGAAVILSGDTLYGTAPRGVSPDNHGTVFSVNADGTDFTILHSFSGGNDGAWPSAGLVLSGNTLYGTTSLGGSSGCGTVFSVNTDGTDFQTLHTFGGYPSDGAYPSSVLVLSGNTLYGTAGGCGALNNGTVFSVNIDGTGYTTLHDFNRATDGASPFAGLVLSGGTLYGTTTSGGSSGNGTVFSVNIDGTGFTAVYSFTGGSDGALPYAGLVLSGNTLYGAAFNGGSSGNGTVFSVNTDGTGFTTLHGFSGGSDGANPAGGMVLSGNTLYGTASAGGSWNLGTVFRVNTDGTNFTTVYSLNGGTDGADPWGGLILSGDTLYGTAAEGGSSGYGTVFSLYLAPGALDHFAISAISSPQTTDTPFAITVVAQDIENNTVTSFDGMTVTFGGTAGVTGVSPAFSSGVLTASVTPTAAGNGLTVTVDDGSGHRGSAVIAEVNPVALDHFAISAISSPQVAGTAFAITITAQDANNNTVTSFDGMTVTFGGTAGVTGTSAPFSSGVLNASVTPAVAGFGLTVTVSDGPSHTGSASISVVNPAPLGRLFRTLYNFTGGGDGANPLGGLILSGSTLYGTANAGGGSGDGTVFSVNTDGNGFRTLHSFSGAIDGANPYAGLILSGKTLYGTAFQGGGYANGTVFSVNTDGTDFTILQSLDGASEGGGPYGGLILSGDTLYGTANVDGGMGPGTVFSVNTEGRGFTALYNFTGGDDGADSYAGLILSGSALYGTACYGGNSGDGTVVVLNTNGTGFTTLHSFNGGSDGSSPDAALVLSGDTLYGTALLGGSWGAGTVFSVNTDGSGFTTLHTFSGGADGGNPFAGLILSGNTLYGTAAGGGSSGGGTVFSVNTDGSGFTTLWNFNRDTDGSGSQAGLLLSGDTLYGTTGSGGTSGCGTVFSLYLAPGPLDHFAISAISSPQVAGTPFAVTITAQDADNTTVTNFGGTVVFGGTAGVAGASPAFNSGVLQTSLMPTTEGGGLTVTVTDGSGHTGSAVIAQLNNAGPLDHFAIPAISSPQAAGTAFPIMVIAQDANNNTATSFGGAVRFGGTAGAVGASPVFSSGVLNASVTPTVAGSGLTVTVNDGSGHSGSTLIAEVNPGPQGPSVQYVASPTSGLIPLTVQFTAADVDSAGSSITSWNWSFGDGSTSTVQSPLHTYSTAGNFAPSLVATDNAGATVLGTGPSAIGAYGPQSQFIFTAADGAITITGYAGPGGAVTIPGTIDGLPVTRIGDQAFYQDTSLTGITIPDSVTNIGNYAFALCAGLASVAIPDSVTSIGAGAFNAGSGLTAVTVGNGVGGIPDYAFAGCSSLARVTVGNGVASISEYAFAYCANLTGVYFQGNAPGADATGFAGDSNATVYYSPVASGWGTALGGIPAALNLSGVIWEPGFAKVEWWYTNNPAEVFDDLAALESGNLGPAQVIVAAPQVGARLDNVGPSYDNGRITCWFVPPATGPYTFYVCSDDQADLFVSTDASAANMRVVAQETEWSSPLEWLSSDGGSELSQKCSDGFVPPAASLGTTPAYSTGISLTAGQEYYLELDHWNGIGGDNCEATVTPAGSPPADGSASSLTGGCIGSYFPRCTYVAFAEQPVSVTNAVAFSEVSFSVGGVTDSQIGIMGQDDPAAGTNNFLLFQWMINGAAVPGANGGSFTLAADPLLNNAQITCQMRALGYADAAGTPIWSNSAPAVLTVAANIAVPAIVTQPSSETNIAGTTALFTVAAAGTPPLSYQWLFNGAVLADRRQISGSATPTLAVTGVQPANAGNYTVQVSNSAGSTVSTGATLVVLVPPSITAQPASLTNAVGSTAIFSASAAGTAPLGYQWEFNGLALTDGGSIRGSATEALTIADVQPTNAGAYSLLVTNTVGAVTSAVAILVVSGPPVVILQPGNVTNIVGTTALFTVSATGTQPLNYQWRFRGAALTDGGQYSGSTTPALTVSGVQPTNAGNYTVRIVNSGGSVVSAAATLTVLVPPSITAQPASRTNKVGSTATFNATAAGTAPLSYQWLWNGLGLTDGGNLSGSATRALTITNAQPTDAGAYSLLVTNAAGAVTSAIAVLTVISPPAIAVQPAGVTNIAGTTAFFTVSATGTQPLNYQWRFKGSALTDDGQLSGSATPTLAVNNVQPTNAGNYTVQVTNSAGSVVSAAAMLTVLVPPSITAQPASRTNKVGSTATFNATAAGTAPLTYQWLWNGLGLTDGGNLSGSATRALTITNAQPTDAGAYSLLVTNAAGAVTSTIAVLTVISPPAIAVQPAGVTNIAGTTAFFTVSATGTRPLSYQWRFKGSALTDGGQFSGSATPTLAVNNVQSTNAGNYTVQVTNSAGSVVSAAAMLTVLVPPSITAQPASRTNAVGKTAAFSATATGTAPLSYQWRFNGLDLTDGGNISGSATRALTITNAQPANAGAYCLLVTNTAGAATSAVSVLTIIGPAKPEIVSALPLTITGIEFLPNKGVQLSVNALPSRACRLEVSADLVNWTSLTNMPTQSGTSQFIDLDATNCPSRFYRVRLTP